MNRYSASGLVADARAGKTVLVITPMTAMIRHAMDEMIKGPLATVDLDTYRVRRSDGEQGIEFRTGGRILMQSARHSIRGLSADIIYLDDGAERLMDDAWRDMNEVVRPHGEIIRA